MIVEEFNEEDFYENIEVFKFVDFIVLDYCLEGDDCYWFCFRVGKNFFYFFILVFFFVNVI